MRLDLFLKKTALIRQRALAKDLCDAGAVSVDGHASKASHAVRVGERIAITTRSRRVVVRVLAVPHGNVARRDAARFVEILSEERHDRITRVLEDDDDLAATAPADAEELDDAEEDVPRE